MKFTLPTFLNNKNKYPIVILSAAICTLLYTLTNRYQLFDLIKLPLTPFEQRLEFIPWMIWVYIGMYIFVVGVFIDLKDISNMNRMAWAYIAVQLIAYITFIFFPVEYPRDTQQMALELNNAHQATRQAFFYLWQSDSPANCFPSLHVANVFLVAFAYINEENSRVKFIIAMIISALIAFSTLATKQHYLWDVIAGIVLPASAFILFSNQKLIVLKSDN